MGKDITVEQPEISGESCFQIGFGGQLKFTELKPINLSNEACERSFASTASGYCPSPNQSPHFASIPHICASSPIFCFVRHCMLETGCKFELTPLANHTRMSSLASR